MNARYRFTAVFESGAFEPGTGDAWCALKILRLQREKGGFTLSPIFDQQTGLEVTEHELRKSISIVQNTD